MLRMLRRPRSAAIGPNVGHRGSVAVSSTTNVDLVPHRLQARPLPEFGLHLVGLADHVVGRRGRLDRAVLHDVDAGLVAVEALSGVRDNSVERVVDVGLVAQRHRHIGKVCGGLHL